MFVTIQLSSMLKSGRQSLNSKSDQKHVADRYGNFKGKHSNSNIECVFSEHWAFIVRITRLPLHQQTIDSC